MSTDRNVTVIFSGINPMATSTGIERYNIKDMKIGDRIKAYCVPVGEGDHKDDPYITLDINDALDHIEKYYGKKFGSTVTVTCVMCDRSHAWFGEFTEGSTEYKVSIGFYAYKVDKGLLMANVVCGTTTMQILNRSNLYSGDRWRLLGPRELSKYILSDLNGTINPKVNPWDITTGGYGNYSFYQSSHHITNEQCTPIWHSDIISFGYYIGAYYGWGNVDKRNNSNYGNNYYTSLFLYQYVESENATNIYY